MARNGQMLLSICRSCRRQLGVSSKHSRAFASTPGQQKTIPTFTPTANDELDEIFLTFRRKFFTPWALAKHHRELIYKASRHQILVNDPGVTVTLSDGEEVKLEPMQEWHRPQKAPTLRRIAELLGTSDDSKRWNNLPAFLEGMKMAKEQLPDGWLEKLVRKANEMGKMGVMIRCAEMVKKTAVRLSDEGVAKEFMIGIHNGVADAGWDAEAVQLAAKRVEQVVLMMDSNEHCGGKLEKDHRDMRKDLRVLGTLLEMEAAKAVYLEANPEIQAKVSECVIKLVFLWRQGMIQVSGRPNEELAALIPLLNGMRLALKVNGVSSNENGKELKSRLIELEELVERLRTEVDETADGKPRRSLLMYHRMEKR